MSDGRWLLYGAYGYTGELIVDEAVRRGHRPTLAGRALEKLKPLAERYGLPAVAFPLDDRQKLRAAIEGFPLVMHAAGPFIRTAEPMRRACLDAGAHYLDITGEIPVFEASFAADREARERGVAILSGVGFDVVPTDCMARYVAERVKDPRTLDIAFSALGGASAGTVKSALEQLPKGNLLRREGHLVPAPLGEGIRRLRFPHGEKTAVPIPWGDLVTAFHTTGVPNITTYMTLPSRQARLLRLTGRALPFLLGPAPVRRVLGSLIERRGRGPDETTRRSGRSYVYVRATSDSGEHAEAWLETLEGYTFTAIASVLAVEKTLAGSLRGAVTPARAFGSDFVLEIPGTRRLDALPGPPGPAA